MESDLELQSRNNIIRFYYDELRYVMRTRKLPSDMSESQKRSFTKKGLIFYKQAGKRFGDQEAFVPLDVQAIMFSEG